MYNKEFIIDTINKLEVYLYIDEFSKENILSCIEITNIKQYSQIKLRI